MITSQMFKTFNEGFGKAILPKKGVSNYFKLNGWNLFDVIMYYINSSNTKMDVVFEDDVLERITIGIDSVIRDTHFPDQRAYYIDLLDQIEQYFQGKNNSIDCSYTFNFNDNSIKRMKRLLRLIFKGKGNGYHLIKSGNYYHLALNKRLYEQYKNVKFFDLTVSLIIE